MMAAPSSCCSPSPQTGGVESEAAAVQQELYAAVSAASSWLDGAESQVLTGPVLLSEDTETQLAHMEV